MAGAGAMQPRRSSLEWIVANRQVRARAVSVGECVTNHREDLRVRGAVRDCITASVNDEFRAHCSLGEIDGHKVVILADSAAACLAVRLAWSTVLREQLSRRCREFKARQIVFRIGTGHDRFMAAADGYNKSAAEA